MIALLLAAGIAAAEPAAAAPPTATTQKEETAKGKMPSGDEFGKMMKVFDKLFPAQPDPDPVRLGKARGAAMAMWPDGTYGSMFETLATTFGNRVLDMKPSDFEMLSDKKDDKAKAAKGKTAEKPKPPEPDISLREKMRREDPNFDRRVEVIMKAAHDELQRLSPLVEPAFREGLSRALARRFNEAQLTDINTFYSSPTGKVYAKESMAMWLDSDIARAMFNSMPAVIMQMPGAMERIKAANDTVPQPPAKKKAN